jgi:hypothetical protein
MIAVVCEVVESHDKVFGALAFLLASAIETSSLEYHVLSYVEERVEFCEDRVVILSVVVGRIRGGEDGFGFFPETI